MKNASLRGVVLRFVVEVLRGGKVGLLEGGGGGGRYIVVEEGFGYVLPVPKLVANMGREMDGKILGFGRFLC